MRRGHGRGRQAPRALSGPRGHPARGVPALSSAPNRSARRLLGGAALTAIVGAVAACRGSEGPLRPTIAIESGLVSPAGDWVLIRGRARAGAEPVAFLRNPASGREVALGRVAPGEPSSRSFAFASSGRRAAWIRERPGFGRASFELMSLDLGSPDAAPSPAPEALPIVSELALAPDGRRAALLEPGVVKVLDVVTGETVAARDLPDWRVPRSLYFAPDGRLRLYPRARLEPGRSTAHELLELDAGTGELTATGSVPVDLPGAIFRPAAAGDLALLLERGRTRISVRDARTGDERAVLPPAGELRGAAFLSEGRVAAVYRAETGGTAVKIFDRNGREEGSIDLSSSPAAVAVLGEPARGRLFLATNPVGANSTRTWSILSLDLAGNRVSRTWVGYAPLDPLEFWTAPALASAAVPGGVPQPGEGADILPFLRSPSGGLARFNPASGELRAVDLAAGRR